MDNTEKLLIGIASIFILSVICFFHYSSSIKIDTTIMVTEVVKYPNRIFIYSYEDVLGFTRFPMGKTLDKLEFVEAGNIYRIIFNGYKIYSVEKIGELK